MSAIQYHQFEGQPNQQALEWLVQINQHIFGFNETADGLSSLFAKHPAVLICIACQDNKPVGFKAGFEDQPYSFESWRGGVLPAARRQGIALELMRLQHHWCQNNGFRVIKTTTNSTNSAMLILNLMSGFEIVGCFVNHRKILKVLQEKRITTN